MPPKRKAETVEDLGEDSPAVPSANVQGASESGSVVKKARVTDAPAEASSSTQAAAPKTWRDITLEGEDEVWTISLPSWMIRSHQRATAGRYFSVVSTIPCHPLANQARLITFVAMIAMRSVERSVNWRRAPDLRF